MRGTESREPVPQNWLEGFKAGGKLARSGTLRKGTHSPEPWICGAMDRG